LPPDRPVALITGATAGIGNAFARRLAADGHDLVLVARDGGRLERVAAELRSRHGVGVEVLPADLTRRDELDRVAHRLSDPQRPVDVLVNNAGFGTAKPLLDSDLQQQEELIALLVTAVLVLTRAALPGMVSRDSGTVITVSSVSGFIVPGGSYAAAKAWATSFTTSVSAQLAGTGVQVTALCPGFVRTEFHARAGMPMDKLPSWAWLDADRVVADCLRDVARKRMLSVPSKRYRFVVLALRHLPLTALRGISRGYASVRRVPRAEP